MSAFDDICRAAREGDKLGLELLFKEHGTINIQQGLVMPIEVLARENNLTAVKLLIDFSCEKETLFDWEGACRGAAMHGQGTFIKVWDLVSDHYSRNELRFIRLGCYNFALQGAAFANNDSLIRYIRSQESRVGFEHEVIGAARAGNFDFVRRYLPNYLSSALKGALCGGHYGFVREMMSVYPDSQAVHQSTPSYSRVLLASVAAMVGDAEFAREVIDGAAEADVVEARDAAVQSAAKCGHGMLARILVREGASADKAAHAALLGGHLQLLLNLVLHHNANPDEVSPAVALRRENNFERVFDLVIAGRAMPRVEHTENDRLLPGDQARTYTEKLGGPNYGGTFVGAVGLFADYKVKAVGASAAAGKAQAFSDGSGAGAAAAGGSGNGGGRAESAAGSDLHEGTRGGLARIGVRLQGLAASIAAAGASGSSLGGLSHAQVLAQQQQAVAGDALYQNGDAGAGSPGHNQG